MSAPNPNAARRWILTIGVAVITVSGAYLGANLKTNQEVRKEYRVVRQATTQEQIKILETQKAKLMAQRTDLEKKLEEVMGRQRKNPDRDP